MSKQMWWRGAVIYQIYPRSFYDANQDGIGDLPGIISKLDYIASLGVDAIWISPFFKSPMKDFGYDISDYRDIDPIFGTLADFDELIIKAHECNIKIMIDQVLSHTSDQHQWFIESREDQSNDKSDWYVWVDAKEDGTAPNNWLSIFGGTGWTWEPRRQQYYLHNFLSSQPDLNFHNPQVRQAVLSNIEFWLKRGVDGFRLDAINFCYHDAKLRDNPAKPKELRQSIGFDEKNPYAYQYHYFNNTQDENLGFIESIRSLLDQYPGTVALGEISSEDSLKTMAEYTQGNGNSVNADAIHNVYGHQWAKMVYENQLNLAPDERPFILMRSGFAGSQRYGMIPWTGDVNRTWGGLKPQVELSLQMGVLGMGYTHSDLGGFAGGEKFDKELYIRWLQYGVFQPIYRPHAQDNIAPEVVFHDKETQDILRKFIKLRYNLLPYNYTLAYQNSTTGMPLMRPLFFVQEPELENEVSNKLIDNARSYLWGDAFLVTPVVDAGVKSVPVDLPKGVWFDYFTGVKHQGSQTVDIKTSLETLPVLVRAGSFVPMIDDIQSTKDYDSSQLTLHYYADESVLSSYYEMYEDDGEMFQANLHGLYELLSFKVMNNRGNISFNLSHKGSGYSSMPTSRQMKLVVHNWQSEPSKVSIGEYQPQQVDWNDETNILTIKFTWQHQPLTLRIEN
jgi:hypothetical protein